jgi:nicotinamidase-related amidase
MRIDPLLSLPDFDSTSTALVITDPGKRFISDKGRLRWLPWEAPPDDPALGNLTALLQAARESALPIFVSRHYYYPMDHGWRFQGSLDRLMRSTGMVPHRGPWVLDDVPLVPVDDAESRPWHATPGQRGAGLTLELHRRGIRRILLAGPAADLCLRGHAGELREQGFQVLLVRDATSFPGTPVRSSESGEEAVPASLTTREVVGALQHGTVH